MCSKKFLSVSKPDDMKSEDQHEDVRKPVNVALAQPWTGGSRRTRNVPRTYRRRGLKTRVNGLRRANAIGFRKSHPAVPTAFERSNFKRFPRGNPVDLVAADAIKLFWLTEPAEVPMRR